MNEQMTLTLTGGVVMPMAGIGTFLLSPDEVETSCVSALAGGGDFSGNEAVAVFLRAG